MTLLIYFYPEPPGGKGGGAGAPGVKEGVAPVILCIGAVCVWNMWRG